MSRSMPTSTSGVTPAGPVAGQRPPGGGATALPGARPAPRVLVADDELSMRELLTIVMTREGYDVVAAENGRQALAALEQGRFDVLVSDLKMPDMSGVEVLRAARAIDPELAGIVITAFASTETAVEALRLGASDYLTKPFDVDELKLKVRKEVERQALRRENLLLKRELDRRHEFANIIGRSEAMLAVFRLIETIAPTSSTVLVTGESGTGKELAARAIHLHSLRRDRPFVALNCGALTETLLESELFGHERGAFTGAVAQKKGCLEEGDGGTVFLDEVGELAAPLQAKLLRALQEREFVRVGGTRPVKVDIRLIAATNRDLADASRTGQFRQDLYYRLNVVSINMPPLRERKDDIPLLAGYFVEKHSRSLGRRVSGISEAALSCLKNYDWPGNIRELENVVEHAVVLGSGGMILPEDLPDSVLDAARPVTGSAGTEYHASVREAKAQLILKTLEQTGHNYTEAAKLLGIHPSNLHRLIRNLNLRSAVDR